VAYLYGGMARGPGTPIDGRGPMAWPVAYSEGKEGSSDKLS